MGLATATVNVDNRGELDGPAGKDLIGTGEDDGYAPELSAVFAGVDAPEENASCLGGLIMQPDAEKPSMGVPT